MRVTELALSQAASPSLARAGMHDVEQLAAHPIWRAAPPFRLLGRPKQPRYERHILG